MKKRVFTVLVPIVLILLVAAVAFGSILFEKFTSASIAKAIVLIIIIIFLQKKPQGLFVVRSRSLDE